ncbi:DUF2127 domain-containing protein [Actinokineospora bangkokensis]|uniref:DUF2127 domain-containing protein n=1 Tax=Actinokineospora bangkokensis TaxID=1193682 RepID=A0A1Q9LCC2_9PSEU|nr:DUF2127 domain-containing protein [Actinokineospora bangkokensis]OLR89655.1 hypothetical protein BJP25_04675 [Actinokineospora bangkokensis]
MSGAGGRSGSGLFRLAVVLKGADGVVQLLGALVLIAVPPSLITGAANAVITRDLLGDHNGTLAHHLSRAAADFADGSTRTFAICYLLLHAVVKLGLVVALWREVVAAFPVACVVLLAFVAYEVARAVRTGSVGLAVFGALDLLVVALVWREFRRLRRAAPAPAGPAVGG